MTTGRPSLAPTLRWLHDRLLGLGFADDQFVVTSPVPGNLLSPSDLEPASYSIEFAALVHRVQRLLGGGRGVSLYVTGRRNDLLARHHVAVQLAAGLVPLGREVVIVDADVMRPGLSGLLADADADGLVDMVRFGRSTRSLLQRPVAGGPWLLPAGSFPADEPAPLAVDALRSVVFRVSQVCDLAIYVGPLPIRNDVHPLVRVCDHVLCAASEGSETDAPARLVESLGELQRHGAHVVGAVWYATPEPQLGRAETAAAMLTVPEPAAEPAPVRFGLAADAAPDANDLLAGQQWLDRLSETAEPDATPSEFAPSEFAPSDFTFTPPQPPAFEPVPAVQPPRDFEPAGDFGAFREPEVEPETLEPAPAELDSMRDAFPAADEEPVRPVGTRRRERWNPRSGRGEDGESGDSESEFAFESESNDSRWIPILVVTLVTLILGFVGWALWARHRAASLMGARPPAAQVTEPRDDAAGATAPSGDAGRTPADGAASTPNDNAASDSLAKQAAPAPAATAPAATAPATPRETATATPRETASATGGTTTAQPSPPPAPAPARETGPPPVREPSPQPARETTPSTTPKASAPARRPTPPAATPPAAGAYGVHVASYKTLGQASKEIAQLQKQGYTANAFETDLGSKGIWYRVYVGSYSTVADAEAARDALLRLPGYNFAQVHRLPR